MIEHSRPLLLTQRLTSVAESELEKHLDDFVVAVSFDPSMPQSELTTRVLLTTLRRGLGKLVLIRDGVAPESLDRIEAAVNSIDPERPLAFGGSGSMDANLRVHIGSTSVDRSIRVVPEGYGAHIVTNSAASIDVVRPANALGAVYAAALGAAEIFKHSAQVVEGRRVIHQQMRFCPVSLSGDLQLAQDLNRHESFDVTLVGAGAIGTGIALIMSELPTGGRFLAVDDERYARENRGTYSLGGDAETQSCPLKVDMIRVALSEFDVETFPHRVEELIGSIDAKKTPWLPTVLTALDSPEARCAAQRLWPDRVIDAGTGDTMLGMSDHRYGVDPCLMCLYQAKPNEQSGVERVARALGLPAELFVDGDLLLAEEHLAGLSEEKRRRLEPHLGKPVCGLARATGLSVLDAAGFMPSVPFISLQAACLSVGRLLASRLDLRPNSNFVQYDGLIGPQTATALEMKKRTGCICSTRKATIDRIRENRMAHS